MERKLKDLNSILETLIRSIDSETLLVVVGDHGMDVKGDHGGDSTLEVSAGLFVYSKKEFVNTRGIDLDLEIKSRFGEDFGGDWRRSDGVPQIDLVPSLALLLGLPVPFGNLGMVIPEFFKELVSPIRTNAQQIHNFVDIYCARTSQAPKFKDSFAMFAEAERKFNNVDSDELDIYFAYVRYIRTTLQVARGIWARFDVNLIVMGVIVCTFAALLSFSTVKFRIIPILGQIIIGTIVGGSIWLYTGSIDSMNLSHIVIFAIAVSISLKFVRFKFPKYIENIQPVDFATAILGTLYFFIVASDSYTIFEDRIILFFLQTIYAVKFITMKIKKDAKPVILAGFGLSIDKRRARVLVCMVIVRLISLSTICRQDQGPSCYPTYNSSSTSSIASIESCLLLFGIMIIAVFWPRRPVKVWWASGVLSVCSYMLLETLESHGLIPRIPIKVWIPRAIWTFSGYMLFKLDPQDYYWLLILNLSLFQKPVGALVIYAASLLYHLDSSKGIQAYLTSQLVFFATGHQSTMSSLQYETGFVGLLNVNWILSPLFVALNTFPGVLIVRYDIKVWGVYMMSALTFAGYFMRHSQSWRVWGPKFLFSVGAFIVGFAWSLLHSRTI